MNETEDILVVLADNQNRQIINLLSKNEHTIQQIATLLNISQTTCYRKIRKLEDLKIIKKTKEIRTLEGVTVSYYKNWTYKINIIFVNGEISYKLEHLKMDDKIIRLWQKFSVN